MVLNEYVFSAGIKNVFHLLSMGMMTVGVVAIGMMTVGVVAMGMMTMVLNENVFSAAIKYIFHLLSIDVVIVDNDFFCWLTLLSSRYLLSFRLLNFLCRSRSRFLFCLLCWLFWHL